MIGSTVAQYEILEQLGSGGMGVVYKALDTKLNRTVALKFLPAQVSQDERVKERFIQEARAASSLDDPHICTIHDIAETDDGQLFIVMAYYDGNTLKYIVDERQIGVEEACSIARQMAQGLSAAHEAGIVHRDVKPANIMVTEKGLVKILDFGVAKLNESSDLTREGSTIGTAAYMSPEQARGESVDKRSDIWSVGAVLYELLTGNRPFGGGYEAAVAYSILNEEPPALETVREELPEGLSAVVSRCLAKKTADRIPSANELADALSAFTDGTAVTTTGQGVASSPAASHGVQRTVTRYVAASVVILGLLYGAMMVLGLPGWVFPAGVLLMLVGLPIVLYSASLDRQRARLDSGERKQLTGIRAWLTTRKALQGGAIAIGGLALLTVAFVGMRAAGIGPFATLISGGTLDRQDQLIVADFANQTSDPTLGATVTEAFRIDLSQSSAIRLMDPSIVQSALMRMQVNPDTALNGSLARAVAEREGVKAIIDGDINAAGASYILNAYIVSASDGSRLAAFRETARDDTEIVDAIDNLSAKLREAIGESLVDIRAGEPLEQVTTASVDALRLYTEGQNLGLQGREAEGLVKFKEAIEADSLFAMAYRKLAVLYGNTGAAQQLQEDAATKAYELRDRLPPSERLLAEAYYYSVEDGNAGDRVINAYEELLRRYPYNIAGLNNLALAYNSTGRYAEAEPLLRRALEVREGTVFRSNLIVAVAGQGRTQEAIAEIDAFDAALPGLTEVAIWRADMLFQQEDFEAAEAWIDSARTRGRQPYDEYQYHDTLKDYLMSRGRVAQALQHRSQMDRFVLDNNVRGPGDSPRDLDSLGLLVDWNGGLAYLTGDTRAFDEVFERTLARVEEIGGIPEDEDPYAGIGFALAMLGRYDEAQEWVEQHTAWHRRSGEEMSTFGDVVAAYVDANRGGDVDSAIQIIEEAKKEWGCPRCIAIPHANLYEKKGDADGAIRVLETALNAPGMYALDQDNGYRAMGMFRLGALYEQTGDLDQSITYYTKMAERWKDADAVLQPQVAEAKRRIEALLDRKAREGA